MDFPGLYLTPWAGSIAYLPLLGLSFQKLLRLSHPVHGQTGKLKLTPQRVSERFLSFVRANKYFSLQLQKR